MAILISDTSVLIDLERAGLLEFMFLLPFEFAVPDLLYERELVGEMGQTLVRLGLRVEPLTSAEVRRATEVNRAHARLSAPDTFAFVLAQTRGWGLLTGDGVLRELATAERLEMHGVLWVIDQFADGGHVQFEHLHSGLSRLLRSALQILFSIKYLDYLAKRIAGSYPFKAKTRARHVCSNSCRHSQ